MELADFTGHAERILPKPHLFFALGEFNRFVHENRS